MFSLFEERKKLLYEQIDRINKNYLESLKFDILLLKAKKEVK